jgi:hypothetical protein
MSLPVVSRAITSNLAPGTTLSLVFFVSRRAVDMSIADERPLAAMVAFSDWEEWANLLLGIWLVASPSLLGFAHTNAMHFSTGVGAAVPFLAALEL